MPLPTIECLKNTVEHYYSTNIHDTKLAGYKPMKGLLGPLFYPGGFGVVFPLQNASGHKYAFRAWHKEINGIKERTRKIAKFLQSNPLPYFVEFDYVEDGLTVVEDNGAHQTVDTIRMEWVNGENLHDFITRTKEEETESVFKSRMLDLAIAFKQMFKDLHQLGISHGDLQHGNIIIEDDLRIKLVDYDSVYVPDIQGEKHITSGLAGYQHPIRKTICDKAAPYDDFFSELIIYSGLLILSVLPDIWPEDEEELDNFSFILTENDFEAILQDTNSISKCTTLDLKKCTTSNIFRKIVNHIENDSLNTETNTKIKETLVLIVNALKETDLSKIKPLPGTEKSKIKSKYKQPISHSTSIDTEKLREDLDVLRTGHSKTKYSGSSSSPHPVKVNVTNKDSRQKKYRNQ